MTSLAHHASRRPPGRPLYWALPAALLPSILVLAGCVRPVATPGDAAAPDTVAAVEALERQRFAALERNDLPALERALAADLVYCHSTARCETRAEFLAALRDGGMRYRRIEVLELRSRVVGDAVLLHGRIALVAEMAGNPAQMQLVYTDVWARRNGRWQLIAWQSTRAPAPAQP
ncbi:MAG: nuclear transport factor 2 family protein [Steroidobacteraceae bacterium]